MAISKTKEEQPIIIKKRKRRHGGAEHGSQTWKIALADFMTSMFIIFMLLWLVKITTPETRAGIAEYFSPASATSNTSGSGLPLSGREISTPGQLKTPSSSLGAKGGGPATPDVGNGASTIDGYMGTVRKPLANRTTTITEEVRGRPADLQHQEVLATQIRQTIMKNRDLKGMLDNLRLSTSPEGLRIEIVDTNNSPMFTAGSKAMNENGLALFAEVVRKIQSVPDKIFIEGHTDSLPYRSNDKTIAQQKGYSNWELSADRANAARRTMVELGVDEGRIAGVSGLADSTPLVANDKSAVINRRLTILLLSPNRDDGSAASEVPLNGRQSNPPAPDGNLIP